MSYREINKSVLTPEKEDTFLQEQQESDAVKWPYERNPAGCTEHEVVD
jgi:hypothetical protein